MYICFLYLLCNTYIYFGGECLLAALGKSHLLRTDTHVLLYVKLDFIDSIATTKSFHPFPFSENVRIAYARRCHTCSRVNRVISGPDKFQHDVDISERVFIRKVFV